VKISKRLAQRHTEALELALSGRPLRWDEREFVLDHFHEGAQHMNGVAGAFFTPRGLARDFSLEVPGGLRVLDLCAGIGTLSVACARYPGASDGDGFVCVELNPDYVEVGRAVLPGATWVNASVFDVDAYAHLGPFDVVVANPPFGRIPADGFEGRYTGGLFEYRVIETASRLAPYGVFIVPQESAPFDYSGAQSFTPTDSLGSRPAEFHRQTGLTLEPNCGLDTSVHRDAWRGVSPKVEIVVCDFAEQRAAASPQRSLPL
jgi:hypothetical protein